MKRRLLTWSIAGLSLCFAPALLQGQATFACRPADSTSVRLVQWLSSIVAGTDGAQVQQRNQMKLLRVSASQISYVTDNKVCSKAVNPYNTKHRCGHIRVPRAHALF
jgi:hypothetical protein